MPSQFGDLWDVLDEVHGHLQAASNLVHTETSHANTKPFCDAVDIPLGIVQAWKQTIEEGGR